jgi:two-component system, NarL family, sensor kinase
LDSTGTIDGTDHRPDTLMAPVPLAERPTARGIAPGDLDSMGPVSVRRPVLHFLVACLAALAAAGLFTAFASRNAATKIALSDVRRVAEASERTAHRAVSDAVLAGDPAALNELDSVVRTELLGANLERIKIWTGDGTIVYSDEPRLIGAHFGLSADELAIFHGGQPQVEVSDLTKPENRFETGPKLLEVYVLSSTTEGTPVLFEAYFRYSDVSSISWQLWGKFAPVALGSLAFVELVQIPLVWRLARRLRSGQVHRERLLAHAIESSNAERRRIAADLHDGVVQELTGQWLSLAAAARSAADPHPQLQASSEAVRHSVMALRSLLVEIYPPNLFEEGLESALEDLLRRLEARGIVTTLVVGDGADRLAPNTVGLLFRVAQEALRNVVAHAAANNVTVRISVDEAVVSLVVADDGRGFPDLRAPEGGHFGLRTLADLVNDAGGRMAIRSAKGIGTEVSVELPVESPWRKGQQS